jgi:hypothetical protein
MQPTVFIAAAMFLSCPLAAQTNNGNATGLPMYPHLTNGSQYPNPIKSFDGRYYLIYTAWSDDAIADVEGWYRRTLSSAKETPYKDQLGSGIELKSGNDKVRIHLVGKVKGAQVELMKFVRAN